MWNVIRNSSMLLGFARVHGKGNREVGSRKCFNYELFGHWSLKKGNGEWGMGNGEWETRETLESDQGDSWRQGRIFIFELCWRSPSERRTLNFEL